VTGFDRGILPSLGTVPQSRSSIGFLFSVAYETTIQSTAFKSLADFLPTRIKNEKHRHIDSF
jgi:hypothetical protein